MTRREGERAQREAAEAAKQRQKLEDEVAPMGVRFKSMVGSKPARWGMSTTQASKGRESYHDALSSSSSSSHDAVGDESPVFRSLGSSEEVDPPLYEHLQAAEMPPVSLPKGLHYAAAERNMKGR